MCPIISVVQIQLTEYQPCFMGPSTLYELNGVMSLTNWGGVPAFTSPLLTSPLITGLGFSTYVEFFILCDDFSIGEDGGRRAFGEWIC